MKHILATAAVLAAVLTPCLANALGLEPKTFNGNVGGNIYDVTNENQQTAIDAATKYCQDFGKTMEIVRYIPVDQNNRTLQFQCK